MAEKPIIFSTLMVQAILAGRKTQTRRVVKPQFPVGLPDGKYRYDGIQEGIHGIELLDADGKPTEKYFSCEKPRFVSDDVLWVRETWAFRADEYVYKANNDFPNGRWHTPIYMPSTAARIFLRVTDVRVERLQEISGKPNDVMTEGGFHNLSQFRTTWDSLNAKRGFGWDGNPWVWVISFERQ